MQFYVKYAILLSVLDILLKNGGIPMKKAVGMADFPVKLVLIVFKMLNPLSVKVLKDECGRYAIMCFNIPSRLRYPKGWYYEKGCFRNKHNTSTGNYSEILMLLPSGYFWGDFTN